MKENTIETMLIKSRLRYCSLRLELTFRGCGGKRDLLILNMAPIKATTLYLFHIVAEVEKII